jgi:hypothetical protein
VAINPRERCGSSNQHPVKADTGVVAAVAPVELLHRVDPTAKIFLDDGTAGSSDEADEILRRFTLQIDVSDHVVGDPGHEATLLTILNTAPRAFRGGVRLRIRDDRRLVSPWAAGAHLAETAPLFGAEIVSELVADHPTVVVGHPPDRFPTSGICLTATHRGWSAGVLTSPGLALPHGFTFAPAAIAAGAIAVAEAFQHLKGGDARAGRRDIGISLWRPGIDWKSPEGWGPESDLLLPSPLQVIGLGHLGQAALWVLGFLDFIEPPLLYLQDDDVSSIENLPTSMLSRDSDLGRLKTRVSADRLERIGFKTRLIERRLDRTHRTGDRDPQVLLAGFDNPAARALLSNTGFDLIVDLGIGAGHRDYLDVRLYSFPASRRSEEIFPSQAAEPVTPELLEQPAWRKLHERTGDRCGVIEIAGQSVGAAFVGAFTAALGVSELVRYYADDRRYELINASLRSFAPVRAVPYRAFEGAENLGYVALR